MNVICPVPAKSLAPVAALSALRMNAKLLP